MSTVQRILLPDTSLSHAPALTAVSLADRICEASGTVDFSLYQPSHHSHPAPYTTHLARPFTTPWSKEYRYRCPVALRCAAKR